jgi:UPF0755 protein
VNSPFNTYLHEGLPPGPICNPRRESIEAVIDPLPDTKELFFVARGQGRHLFSRTYAEHLANIRSVRSKPGAGAGDTLGLPPDSMPALRSAAKTSRGRNTARVTAARVGAAVTPVTRRR